VKTENQENENDNEADVKVEVKEIGLLVQNEEELGFEWKNDDDVVVVVDNVEYMRFYFRCFRYLDVKSEIDLERNQDSKDER
jgi:hypothetical protein